jgi:hypothetical protein
MPVTESSPLVDSVSATLPVRDHKRERERTVSQTLDSSILDDILDTLKLGVPIAVSYLSWVGVSYVTIERICIEKLGIQLNLVAFALIGPQKKTTDSALLGHVSQQALAAASLSDLWTMTTQVLLSGRVLRVLVGGAIGSGTRY